MKRVMLVGVLALAACGGGGGASSKYPARPEGCPVQEFQDAPTMPTENIGRAEAICGASVTPEQCKRELFDQVCKLGGDVVWGVTSSEVNDKTSLSGRAAHTK